MLGNIDEFYHLCLLLIIIFREREAIGRVCERIRVCVGGVCLGSGMGTQTP